MLHKVPNNTDESEYHNRIRNFTLVKMCIMNNDQKARSAQYTVLISLDRSIYGPLQFGPLNLRPFAVWPAQYTVLRSLARSIYGPL
jgi:hypothetical protein